MDSSQDMIASHEKLYVAGNNGSDGFILELTRRQAICAYHVWWCRNVRASNLCALRLVMFSVKVDDRSICIYLRKGYSWKATYVILRPIDRNSSELTLNLRKITYANGVTRLPNQQDASHTAMLL